MLRNEAVSFQASACYFEGKTCYESKNYTKAIEWYKKSAEKGNAGAKYELGLMYHKGVGVPQNYIEAFKWLKSAILTPRGITTQEDVADTGLVA